MKIEAIGTSLGKIDALDQELIIAHEINKSREFVLAHPEFSLSPEEIKKIAFGIARREQHEPLAYILQEKEFFSLSFKVSPATLIPRPETELLVEKVLALPENKNPQLLLEIGTGSGCIVISLAKKRKNKNWKFLANDISTVALKIAEKNSRKNQTQDLIDFFSDDLLGTKTLNKIHATAKKQPRLEIILVANLPYISKKEYTALDPSVKDFEPESALLSGQDGFDHYRKLLTQLQKFSQKNPALNWKIFWEIGHQQKTLAQKEIQKKFPQSQPTFSKDLAGHWRNVSFKI